MPSSDSVKNSSRDSAEPRPAPLHPIAETLDVTHLTETVRPFLEEVVSGTDFGVRLQNDPVGLVHAYDRDEDREVAAMIASCLAYGRVASLRRAVSEVLAILGPRPATRLVEVSDSELRRRLDGFVYRMTRGADVLDLLVAVRSVLEEFGSLEASYRSVDGDHLGRASRFVRRLRSRGLRSTVERGFRYLLCDPADGSATKRLHMFFRWVGRGPDEVDLGLWRSLDARELVMPLDTHTSRLCRYVGLTDRASADQKAAREVTAGLAVMRPDDPLYYDFALAHLGISGRCIHRRSADHCPGCALEPICTL